MTSIIRYTDGPSAAELTAFHAGIFFVLDGEKQAADAEVAYSLSGMLQLSSTGYLLVSVPNAFVRGIFAAMDEPGIELPPGPSGLNAHVTVMSPQEIAQIGGPDVITERGKLFNYTLGRLVTFVPDGWPDISRVWCCSIMSPALKSLRRTYGLAPDRGNGFHVTVAVRRKHVLGNNDTSKAITE